MTQYLHKTGSTNGSYIRTLNQLANFNLAAAQHLTIAGWFRPLSAITFRAITGYSQNSGTKGWVVIRYSDAAVNQPALVFDEDDADGGSTVTSTYGVAFTLNTWNHLAITIDRTANLQKLYVNGIERDADSIVGMGGITATVAVYVGAARPDSGVANADIASVEYYKSVATGPQIATAAAGSFGTLLAGMSNRIGIFEGNLFTVGDLAGATANDADGNTWEIVGAECIIAGTPPSPGSPGSPGEPGALTLLGCDDSMA